MALRAEQVTLPPLVNGSKCSCLPTSRGQRIRVPDAKRENQLALGVNHEERRPPLCSLPAALPETDVVQSSVMAMGMGFQCYAGAVNVENPQ